MFCQTPTLGVLSKVVRCREQYRRNCNIRDIQKEAKGWALQHRFYRLWQMAGTVQSARLYTYMDSA